MICGALKKDGTECQMKVTSKKGCRYHSSGVAKRASPKRASPKRGSPKRTTPKRTTPKREVFLVCEEHADWNMYRDTLAIYDSLKKAEAFLDKYVSGHKTYSKRVKLGDVKHREKGILRVWETNDLWSFYVKKMKVL